MTFSLCGIIELESQTFPDLWLSNHGLKIPSGDGPPVQEQAIPLLNEEILLVLSLDLLQSFHF